MPALGSSLKTSLVLTVLSAMNKVGSKKTIRNKAHFNINHLNPLSKVSKCHVPAFFVHGEQDEFVLPHHSKTLVNKYGGEVTLTLVEGDHNAIRP